MKRSEQNPLDNPVLDKFKTIIGKPYASGYGVQDELNKIGVRINDIPSMIDGSILHQLMMQSFSLWKEQQLVVPFVVGYLHVLLAPDVTPPEVRSRMSHDSGSINATIKVEVPASHGRVDGDYYLCDDAEDKLYWSLQKSHRVMLIDDTFLVKGEGKLAAVCLRTMETPTGTLFTRGSWYIPSNGKQHTFLYEERQKGPATMWMGIREWTYVRPLQHPMSSRSPDVLLTMADEAATRLRS